MAAFDNYGDDWTHTTNSCGYGWHSTGCNCEVVYYYDVTETLGEVYVTPLPEIVPAPVAWIVPLPDLPDIERPRITSQPNAARAPPETKPGA